MLITMDELARKKDKEKMNSIDKYHQRTVGERIMLISMDELALKLSKNKENRKKSIEIVKKKSPI